MKFFSFNQVLRWIALAITIVFLSGCAAANYDPAVPVGLLTKSRDFLFFCLCIDYSGINVPLVAVCNVPPVAQCNVPPQKWLQ